MHKEPPKALIEAVNAYKNYIERLSLRRVALISKHMQDGVSFKDAALAFQHYCGGETPLSYGDDHRYLNYNRDDLYGLSIPPFTGQDLRPLFMAIDPATQHINSGRLAAHFGLNAKIQEHYALEDCRSIQAALKHFQNHPELLSYFKRPSP